MTRMQQAYAAAGFGSEARKDYAEDGQEREVGKAIGKAKGVTKNAEEKGKKLQSASKRKKDGMGGSRLLESFLIQKKKKSEDPDGHPAIPPENSKK